MRWARACLGTLLLTLATLCASAASPKRVLLLYSLGRGFEPYHTTAGRLRTELASQMAEPIDFFEASLESARFTSLEQESPLLQYLQAQFAGHHLDLVIPIGGPATQFVQRHRQQLFPETPMLAAVDQRLFNPNILTTNDAAVMTVNEPGLTVEMLLQVLPETTNVVVVMGNSAIERFWSAQIQRELQPYTNGVNFVWLDQLPFSEMLKRCATLPPRSAIFFPLLFVDAAGVPHLEEHAMLRLHEAANAPIFGVWINQLGQGILGGRLMHIEEYSRNAANVAARLLRGESPASIKMPLQRVGPPEFDWRELRRWGISEARLPPGSVVRFRQPGIWERYWWLFCGGILFGAAEAALIVGLLVNRAKRRHGERMATLIADLSSRFINLPADKVDPEIEAAQRSVCESMGLDLCALWQWTDGSPRYFKMTHLYDPLGGGPPTPEQFDAQEAFPWSLKELLAGKVVSVSSMDALPPEAGRDRESWLHFGIKSNLTFPLLIQGGQLIGGLSFNTVRKARSWPSELAARLELFAQIFAHALARKRAELTLRASEELNRATFEQAAVGIAHVGTDGRWLRINDKLCAIVGYAPEELLNMTFQDITHPDDLETDLGYVRQVLSGEIKTYSIEKRYFRKDRSLVWTNLTVSLVRTPAGEPKHFIAMVEDITEAKQAELDLLRQRAELAHVTRVSTMGELAASVAHELNQPLGAILANAEAAELFLEQDPPALGEVREVLAAIRKDDERAAEVIRRMRALLRKRELERQPLSINSLVEDIVQLVSGDAALRGVSLAADLAPALPEVSGDRVYLQQVVLNLILNGMDAMASLPREKRRLSILTHLAPDLQVEIAVTDSGPGIKPDKLPRLFEPFFTTKPNGMGMGLSIAHTIIEAHRGRIWAENRLEGGAVFRVLLPAGPGENVTEGQDGSEGLGSRVQGSGGLD